MEVLVCSGAGVTVHHVERGDVTLLSVVTEFAEDVQSVVHAARGVTDGRGVRADVGGVSTIESTDTGDHVVVRAHNRDGTGSLAGDDAVNWLLANEVGPEYTSGVGATARISQKHLVGDKHTACFALAQAPDKGQPIHVAPDI